MADVEDVRDAMAALAAFATHPGGVSVTGQRIAVYSGMPNGTKLDADLAAGAAHVSVMPLGTFRLIPQGFGTAVQSAPAPPTTTATIAGNVVTLGGTITPGFPIHVIVGGVHFPYLPVAGDTLAAVASALAAAAGGAAAGAAITLPAGQAPTVRMATIGTETSVTRRQAAGFKVAIYAPSPAARRVIGAAVDGTFAQTPHIALPDQQAILTAIGDAFDDGWERAGAYTRTLRYQVEYDTTATITSTTIAETVAKATAPGIPITVIY